MKRYSPFSRPTPHDLRQRGFTLIEVLIAVVILSTGLVLVVEGMGRTQQALSISKNLINASLVVETQLVEIEMDAIKYQKLSTGSKEGKAKVGSRFFNWETTVRPYVDAVGEGGSSLNKVEASVEWSETAGRKGRLSVGTLFANREKKDEAVQVI